MGKSVGLVCGAITFIILGGFAILIAWLADNMKSPTFYIDRGAIDNYNFSNNDHLNATFTFVTQSHNRDHRYKIKYHVVAVSVYHTNGYALAYDTLGPYVQGPKGDLVFSAQPVVRDVLVSDPGVAGSIRNESRGGELSIEVRVRASVRFEVKWWKHKNYVLKISCLPLVINLVSGKTNQGINCDVIRF